MAEQNSIQWWPCEGWEIGYEPVHQVVTLGLLQHKGEPLLEMCGTRLTLDQTEQVIRGLTAAAARLRASLHKQHSWN